MVTCEWVIFRKGLLLISFVNDIVGDIYRIQLSFEESTSVSVKVIWIHPHESCTDRTNPYAE